MPRIRFLRALRILWKEYCEENSINAMKHLMASNQGLLNRGWWGVSVMVASILSVLSAVSTYQKWVQNPIYISYEPQQIPMWQVPFPAVTVCPIVQSKGNYYDINHAAIWNT
ncbi:pickpocket protein 28-like isoform X2 [Uranotaenia lowii]|uniref:pickpocket protein 28-like isoform X2 n=1 Tax=Uranotaenia lowii TaxID=190385 RepID=UPI0024786297|nr:pickpocket protein 28-like isoform X2 [Uranotaenia lowii]